jgi:multisubunit Na+/H+ antiporter MnhC subunit
LRGRGGKGVVLAALGMALLWAALVLVIGLAGVLVPPGLLPPLQANDYGYERAFTLIGVVVLTGVAAIIGFAGAVVAGLLARGRAQAQL